MNDEIPDEIKALLPSFFLREFPEAESVVYVVICKKGSTSVPFYVGESADFQRRMADYRRADFNAQTDFKVGEAVKYFKSEGCQIEIAIRKDIGNRKSEENRLKMVMRSHDYRLLNDFPGYDYRRADSQHERTRIQHEFCDELLTALGEE